MANEKFSINVNVLRNTNSSSATYGKWYPRLERKTTLSTRGLADHIANHGSIYTRDIIVGLLSKLSTCIPELVAEGHAVKLDGLGTFFPTAESDPEKGGVSSLEGYNPSETVKGIHIRFLPDDSSLDRITSRAFKERCTLKAGSVIELNEVTDKTTGKKSRVRTLTPIDDYVRKQNAAND